MKNKELFEKTVGILVNAYQNDTLRHSMCSACAVGNIVAANLKYTINTTWCFSWVEKPVNWWRVFMTSDGRQQITTIDYKGKAKEEIDSTGYTWKELAKIEYAFETASKGSNDDEWMFNGLLAVYDVLCEIHEVSKGEVKSGELVFVK